jgi:quercetin dioxygenase-like cupin family protein
MAYNSEILLQNGGGDAYWFFGDIYTFKVTGKETNGAFTIFDQVVQPQNGPPPHIHHREDEAFYVIEGRFSFLSGDKETVCEAGSFIYIPRGVIHTFKNIGDTQGKLLVTFSPAGLEGFFYALATPATDLTKPPLFDPAVSDKLLEFAKEYAMDIVLPAAK